MDEKTIRMIIRDENNKSNKLLKKDLKDVFMTRRDCYSMHQGRTTSKASAGGNGELRKEKILFWSKLVGLVTGLTTAIGIVIAFMSSKLG